MRFPCVEEAGERKDSIGVFFKRFSSKKLRPIA